MPTAPPSIVVLIPLYNDWDSTHLLLRDLDATFRNAALRPEVLFVDECSTAPVPDSLSATLPGIRRLDILELRRNLGHQRASAVGLAFFPASRPCDSVVVMHGDGEHKPSDVVRLLDEFERELRSKIVFAERTRRSEGFCFRVFYETLDSTLPLPVLIGLAEDAPADVRDAAALLRSTNLFLIEVAARHPSKRQDQWLYVYDEDSSPRASASPRSSPPRQRAPVVYRTPRGGTALPTGLPTEDTMTLSIA